MGLVLRGLFGQDFRLRLVQAIVIYMIPPVGISNTNENLVIVARMIRSLLFRIMRVIIRIMKIFIVLRIEWGFSEVHGLRSLASSTLYTLTPKP